MIDIVERLRFHPADEDEVYNLFNEAADEIVRLRVDIEILRNEAKPITFQDLEEIGAITRRFKEIES